MRFIWSHCGRVTVSCSVIEVRMSHNLVPPISSKNHRRKNRKSVFTKSLLHGKVTDGQQGNGTGATSTTGATSSTGATSTTGTDCANSVSSGRLLDEKTDEKNSLGHQSSQLRSQKESKSRTSLNTLSNPSLDNLVTAEDILQKRGFTIIKMAGEGAFAKVFVVHDKDDKKYALKVFDLTSSNTNKGWVANCLKKEMMISKKLKHPNIIMTYDVLKTRRFGYIQMKFAPNGNIKSELYEKNKRPYTEDEARNYFKGLMEGLNHMHEQNICHRDLKLENFLLSETYCPMIADFGFASIGVKQSNDCTTSAMVLTSLMRGTRCGTNEYMAPELKATPFKPPYDAKAVDVYAMGICLFEMVNFCYPHQLPGNYLVNGKLSDSLNELVGLMLKAVPNERIKSASILNHCWLTYNISLFNSILKLI